MENHIPTCEFRLAALHSQACPHASIISQPLLVGSIVAVNYVLDTAPADYQLLGLDYFCGYLHAQIVNVYPTHYVGITLYAPDELDEVPGMYIEFDHRHIGHVIDY